MSEDATRSASRWRTTAAGPRTAWTASVTVPCTVARQSRSFCAARTMSACAAAGKKRLFASAGTTLSMAPGGATGAFSGARTASALSCSLGLRAGPKPTPAQSTLGVEAGVLV